MRHLSKSMIMPCQACKEKYMTRFTIPSKIVNPPDHQYDAFKAMRYSQELYVRDPTRKIMVDYEKQKSDGERIFKSIQKLHEPVPTWEAIDLDVDKQIQELEDKGRLLHVDDYVIDYNKKVVYKLPWYSYEGVPVPPAFREYKLEEIKL